MFGEDLLFDGDMCRGTVPRHLEVGGPLGLKREGTD